MAKKERAFRGDRLRRARESAGLTQAELTELLGLGTNQISLWERGVSEPLPYHIKKLSDHLKVSADWLLGLSDDPGGIQSLSRDEKIKLILETMKPDEVAGLLQRIAQRLKNL